MDKPLDHFAQQEFSTLREEIRDLKSRRFQVITGGVVATPVIFGIAQQLEIMTVLLLMPLLVVATVLLEVSENNGIYRAGEYISKVIMSYFIDNGWRETYPGWERWLEDEQHKESRRHADRVANVSFLIIFCVYYVAYASVAVVMLGQTLYCCLAWSDYWRALTDSLVIFTYVIIFLHMLYFYYNKCLWCIDARSEKNGKKCG